MTPADKTELERRIAVMRACGEGRAIEVHALDNPTTYWHACTPLWDWFRFDYRIAPEPRKAREFYLWQWGDGEYYDGKCDTAAEAIADFGHDIAGGRPVLFREVIEDQT